VKGSTSCLSRRTAVIERRQSKNQKYCIAMLGINSDSTKNASLGNRFLLLGVYKNDIDSYSSRFHLSGAGAVSLLPIDLLFRKLDKFSRNF